jgi:hypothetical protein
VLILFALMLVAFGIKLSLPDHFYYMTSDQGLVDIGHGFEPVYLLFGVLGILVFVGGIYWLTYRKKVPSRSPEGLKGMRLLNSLEHKTSHKDQQD